MTTQFDFTTTGLSLRVSGPGVAFDPETGTITFSATSLQEGIALEARPEGSNTLYSGVFKWGIARTPPAALRAPSLSGTGRIGAALDLDPGQWEGQDALEIVWLRDGAPIPGAGGVRYVPETGDDGAALSARVTARNVAGETTLETEAIAIVFAAPQATGALADLVLTQGDEMHRIDAAAAFAGENLTFSVAGAGAGIDAASGLVSVPRTALMENVPVEIGAENSGGAARLRFAVTVRPALEAPRLTAALPDVKFDQGSGVRTISAQAGFAGDGLTYSLAAPVAGVEIAPLSGLVRVDTAHLLPRTELTVRAGNAAGAVSQDFALSVVPVQTAAPARTVFDTPAALDEVTFLSENAAPEWAAGSRNALLRPVSTGRVHGDWAGAGGAGLYRALIRLSSNRSTDPNISPFLFGAGISRDGGNFTGLYVEAFDPEWGKKYLRLKRYTGAGVESETVAEARPHWRWDTWSWVEMDIEANIVRARIYPDGEAAPDWQIEAEAGAGVGAFGPGTIPIAAGHPDIRIAEMSFTPRAGAVPAPSSETPDAPADDQWSAQQYTK